MYDICIIGAGIIGCSIARELSRYNVTICLLEKEEDVATGATKANSGIIHGGYDDKHGSVKSRFSAPGNRLYRQLNRELQFGLKEIGSFVLGFDDQDKNMIQYLYENGIRNGAQGLSIVTSDFVKSKEPHINDAVKMALYCESAAIVSPFEVAIALAENAISNGVNLKLNTVVTAIHRLCDCFSILTSQEEIRAKVLINAAGLYSDVVSGMVGLHDFTIKPRKGQYLLFDKDQGDWVRHVIFQTPSKKGKGTLVTPTFHGNLLMGPDAEDISNPADVGTTSESIDYVIQSARKSLSAFDLRKIISTFAGNRAISSTGDFIIGQTEIDKFIQVAGIDSPGLTAAPAIAKYVVELIDQVGLSLKEKSHFDPYREPTPCVADMSASELNQLILKNPHYGHIVCRCEVVSEGEVLDALRKNIPIENIDAIKRRTRCGMGRCHGGFCLPRLLEIIEQEKHLDRSQISKKGTGSEFLMKRTKRVLKDVSIDEKL